LYSCLSLCFFLLFLSLGDEIKLLNRKNLLNSNMFSTCLHTMANVGPLTAEIGSGVWAPQQTSTVFVSCLRYCSDVAHRRPTKLRTMFDRLLGWYTRYTHAKLTLRPSLAFAYIGSVTARHSSSRRQPNFGAWYKEWNYGTFADDATYIRQGGHHGGHCPIF